MAAKGSGNAMRRREFIKIIASTVTPWPLVAHAPISPLAFTHADEVIE
jgi:hypothetical protein